MKLLLFICLINTTPETAITTDIAIDRDTLRDNAVLSARGPETGRGALSLSTTWLLDLPMADFRYVYGVSDLLQTELQLRTIGILNFGELVGRFRLVEGPHFSFALRAGAHGMLGLFDEGDDVELSGGGGPAAGVMLSAGGESFQVTMVAEARYAFLDGGSGWMTASALGVEFPLGHPVNGFFEAKVLSAFDGGEAVHLPFVTHGISW